MCVGACVYWVVNVGYVPVEGRGTIFCIISSSSPSALFLRQGVFLRMKLSQEMRGLASQFQRSSRFFLPCDGIRNVHCYF